jgi:hypothetical protein
MIPPAEQLCPPEVKTPEERFEYLGRKLFSVTPEQLREREAAWEAEQRANEKQKPGPKPVPKGVK